LKNIESPDSGMINIVLKKSLENLIITLPTKCKL